jgi:glycine/D-amino acid oxidase-like deaminating enzyme
VVPTGAAEADVAIVGAGLTGLWTALFLKDLEPAGEVAVLDQGLAAYGASGRNAGMLSKTIDHGHALAIEHFGKLRPGGSLAWGDERGRDARLPTAALYPMRLRADRAPNGGSVGLIWMRPETPSRSRSDSA